MGDAFLELWQSEGLDASRVSRHPTAPTGVSFVTHGPAGHKFDYLRKNSAASLMTPETLPADYIAGARYFHLSAIGQAIIDSARKTRDAAVSAARAAGVKVSYDTNLRLRLWDLDVARATIDATVARCDVLLPSLDDSLAAHRPGRGGRHRRSLPQARRAHGRAENVGRRLPDRHAQRAVPRARPSCRGGRCDRRRRHVRRLVPGPPAGGRRSRRRRVMPTAAAALDQGLRRGDAYSAGGRSPG